jgi:hypothetical protein
MARKRRRGLLGNDLERFVETLAVARRTRGIIWQNFAGDWHRYTWRVLAASGFLNPLLAAGIHVVSGWCSSQLGSAVAENSIMAAPPLAVIGGSSEHAAGLQGRPQGVSLDLRVRQMTPMSPSIRLSVRRAHDTRDSARTWRAPARDGPRFLPRVPALAAIAS